MEWVAEFTWNWWPISHGIDGRIAVEYAQIIAKLREADV
jgi:hypothetical protein